MAFVDRGRLATQRHVSVNLVYDRKPRRYAEHNRTDFNYTHKYVECIVYSSFSGVSFLQTTQLIDFDFLKACSDINKCETGNSTVGYFVTGNIYFYTSPSPWHTVLDLSVRSSVRPLPNF